MLRQRQLQQRCRDSPLPLLTRGECRVRVRPAPEAVDLRVPWPARPHHPEPRRAPRSVVLVLGRHAHQQAWTNASDDRQRRCLPWRCGAPSPPRLVEPGESLHRRGDIRAHACTSERDHNPLRGRQGRRQAAARAALEGECRDPTPRALRRAAHAPLITGRGPPRRQEFSPAFSHSSACARAC
jgi:hypothetical protein